MDRQDNRQPLCALSHIGASGKEVRIEEPGGTQWLMLFHRDGVVSAWRNVCPHQGRALNFAPDRFLFTDDGLLVCAHHGATFELPSGACVAGPCQGARLTAMPISVKDGQVYLEDQ